jgi:hypothetical protein
VPTDLARETRVAERTQKEWTKNKSKKNEKMDKIEKKKKSDE